MDCERFNLRSANPGDSRLAHSGASDRTQRMADRIAKADPELAERAAHSEVSLARRRKSLRSSRPTTRG